MQNFHFAARQMLIPTDDDQFIFMHQMRQDGFTRTQLRNYATDKISLALLTPAARLN